MKQPINELDLLLQQIKNIGTKVDIILNGGEKR